MKSNKRIAVGLSAALAVTGLAGITGVTAAHADAGASYPNINCQINNVALSPEGADESSQPGNVSPQIVDVTSSAASGPVGQTVNITIDFHDAFSPHNGGASAIAPNTTRAEAVLDVNGSIVRIFNPANNPGNAADFEKLWPAGIPTITQPITLPATPGPVVVKFLRLSVNGGDLNDGGAGSFDSYCAPVPAAQAGGAATPANSGFTFSSEDPTSDVTITALPAANIQVTGNFMAATFGTGGQAIPNVAKRNQRVTVTGATLGASGEQVQLYMCDFAAFTNCDPAIAGNLKTLDAAGAFTGSRNFQVAAAPITGSSRGIWAQNTTTNATVKASNVIKVLGAVTVTVNGSATPAALPVGSPVTISVTNGEPGKAIACSGATGTTTPFAVGGGGAPPAPNFTNADFGGGPAVCASQDSNPVAPITNPARPLAYDANGNLTFTWTPTADDLDSESLSLILNSNSDAAGLGQAGAPAVVAAVVPISVSANRCIADVTCNVNQTLSAEVTINTDGLTLGQNENATTFPAVQVSPNPQVVTAALDTTWVQDARGGNFGWDSSAFMATDFIGSNPSHVIPVAGNFGIQPTCAVATEDIDGNPVAAPLAGNDYVQGGPGPFTGTGSVTPDGNVGVPGAIAGEGVVTNGVSLCSVPNVATGNGGTWTQEIVGGLQYPAFQAADTYSATLTIVLTSK